MIGRLRGEIVLKQPPFLMLDVNGVGYEIEAPMSTFYELPAVGEIIILFTHLMIRDDAHVLYAFYQEQERLLFRTLLKISGVGGKMALAILSGMNAGEFSQCIQNEDVTALVRIPGVGKKTAQRLIIEMKDKLVITGSAQTSSTTASAAAQESPASEAVSALVALGYRPVEANRLVKSVEAEGLGSEELIRAALQSLIRK
ncbi:MAG: Holliday junction branch migration protein RuvA [Pseudomonadota bacterium]|nr:Holliday junction branch migration protein RuvA [Pseudomonadota bacterium]